MLAFHNMFKPIATYSAVSGLCVPGIPGRSAAVQKLLKLYSLLSLTPTVIFGALILYLLVFQWDSVADVTLSINILCAYFYSTCIALYFYFYKHRFDTFLSRLDATASMFYENIGCETESFLKTLNSFVKKANVYSMYYCVIFTFYPTFYLVLIYIKYLFGFHDADMSALQLPYQSTGFYTFTLTVAMATSALAYSNSKRCFCDSFFAVNFMYLNFYFKQLGILLEDICNESTRTSGSAKNLKIWIAYHQDIQRYPLFDSLCRN